MSRESRTKGVNQSTHVDSQDQRDHECQLEENEGAVEEISALGIGRSVALDVVSDQAEEGLAEEDEAAEEEDLCVEAKDVSPSALLSSAKGEATHLLPNHETFADLRLSCLNGAENPSDDAGDDEDARTEEDEGPRGGLDVAPNGEGDEEDVGDEEDDGSGVGKC